MREIMPLSALFKTFRHGTHPPARKDTAGAVVSELPVPGELFVSLGQHIGAPAKAVVAAGDRVLEGQLLAEPAPGLSAAVHSPVSGTVKGVVKLPVASGASAEHIVVENDGRYEKSLLPPLPEDASPSEIVERVREAGIVGMGGAGFPTAVKLTPKEKIDTLIVNGAECEPYITCDCRVMQESAEEVVRGALLLARAVGASRTVIAVEKNKPEAVAALRAAAEGRAEVLALRVKYPQGAEKQLIYAATGRRVPAGGLPSAVGCVVDNAQTALAVARAVLHGEAPVSRVITVAGGGVEKRGNFRVRVGTPFSFVYECVRGDKPETLTDKVISGGPMMGTAQADLSACCTKTTSALLFLSHDEISVAETTDCINCGRCLRSCPMFLPPREIERAVLSKDAERARTLGVEACMECGVCSYVCPAKRPLVQAMRLAKRQLKGGGK